MNELEKKAYELAKIIYGKNKRPLTQIKRIRHVENIVKILRKVEHTDEMLASAWLFDALDRINLTDESRIKFLKDIRQGFGIKTAKLLDGCLPKATRAEYSKLFDRMIKDIEHYAVSSAQAQSIKLADTLEYLQSLRALYFYTAVGDGNKRKLVLKNQRLAADMQTAERLVKADNKIRQELIDTVNLMHKEIDEKLLTSDKMKQAETADA